MIYFGGDSVTEEKCDRRVRYTKMMLRQALLELMKGAPIDNISVTDLCKMADISRGTFYAHYTDAHDLLNQIEQALLSDLQRILTAHLTIGERCDINKVMLELLECISYNGDICTILLSDHGDDAFLRQVLNVAQELYFKMVGKQAAENYALFEYVFSFLANASMGIIQRWVQDGMREPAAFLAEIVDKVVNSGATGFITGELVLENASND